MAYKKFHKKVYMFLSIILFMQVNVSGLFSDIPDWEVEILDNPSPGYLSMSFRIDSVSNLMDNYGNFQFPVGSENIVNPFKFLQNGLWIGLGSNYYYLSDQNFKIVDSIPLPENYPIDFHDVILLANGHYLIICSETIVMDLSKIINGGKTNANVISTVLIESDKAGNIYWTWKALDHYSITDYPVDEDLKNQTIDFTHPNSLFEDSDGNILVSMRSLDEITKINKSTGNIIWRLGGKLSKKNQFTFLNDNYDNFYGFSHQHSISIVENGNLLLFDNGNRKPNPYSRAVEYKLDHSAKTATKVWEYRPNPDIYLSSMGSVFRLPTGNTIMNFSTLGNTGTNKLILEVKPDNSIAFKLNYNGDKKRTFLYANRYITRMDAVTKNISSTGNYIFNDNKFSTGIEIKVDNISGSGITWIEKHRYAPVSAEFIDSNFAPVLPMRWVFSKNNINSLSGKFQINTNLVNGINYPEKVMIYHRKKESKGQFQPLVTDYNYTTKMLSAPLNDFGEYILVDLKLDKPTLNYPGNNQNKITVKNSLKWNKLSGASHYQIQLSKSSNMIVPVLDTTKGAEFTSQNFYGLENNTSYYWRVRGINHKDTSEWSSVYMFITIDHNLFVPDLINPVNQTTGFDIRDSLRWSEVPKAENYILNISESPDFLADNSLKFVLSDNYMTAGELKHYTKYYWRVMSIDNKDSTEWSETWQFTTKIPEPILEYPQDNSHLVAPNDYATWESVVGAIKYQLQVSKFQDFTVILIDTTVITGIQHNLNSLGFGLDYYWRVRAISSKDTSSWSSIWAFRTLLSAPDLIYPQSNQKGVASNSMFTWYYDISAPLFDFQLSENSDFTNLLIDTENIAEGNIVVDILDYNKKYFWRVRLRNNEHQSIWSDAGAFMSAMDKPATIYPLANSVDVSVDSKFIWVSQHNSFRIQIAKDLFFEDIVSDEIVSNISEYQTKLSISTIYYWRIKVETDENFSGWSDIIKFTTSPTTHVEESEEYTFSIYPSPAGEYITIQNSEVLKTSEIYEVQIFDFLGIEIISESIHPMTASHRMNVENLPSGVYFIRIGNKVEKFVKM